MIDFWQQQILLHRFRQRLGNAGLVIVVLFVVLVLRFTWLQVIKNSYYQMRAEDNRLALIPITPVRGLITDRNGEVLARSDAAYTLMLTPSADTQNDIDELAALVAISPRDLREFRRRREANKNIGAIELRSRLSDEEVARFVVNRYRLPRAEIKVRLFRHYPHNELASHTIGHLGRIDETDTARLEKNQEDANYRGTDFIGKMGIENSFEAELHGISGQQQVEVDAAGRAMRTLAEILPQPGQDIRLTIDLKLQQTLENQFADRQGAAVAIDPKSGEILAMVSRPNFNPNYFVAGIDPATWQELNTSPTKPMLNRAIAGTYSPGSTIKPYLALAALFNKVRTPEQTITDQGSFTLGGHVFRDDKPGGHGSVDMYKAIVQSCDTYYYMLANDLGIDRMADFLHSFSFGSLTQIDISGEQSGTLPSTQWKQKRFKSPGQQKWYAGETISAGIGQSYHAYTPLQLAAAVAMLANQGTLMRPHLLQAIREKPNGSWDTNQPQVLQILQLPQEHWAFVNKAMIGVNKEGTGASAFANAPYISAGKTGTAQLFSLKGGKYGAHVKKELRDHALFIAYAPAENPTIAVAIIVENAGFGAVAAAPIARKLFDAYLLPDVSEAEKSKEKARTL